MEELLDVLVAVAILSLKERTYIIRLRIGVSLRKLVDSCGLGLLLLLHEGTVASLLVVALLRHEGIEVATRCLGVLLHVLANLRFFFRALARQEVSHGVLLLLLI